MKNTKVVDRDFVSAWKLIRDDFYRVIKSDYKGQQYRTLLNVYYDGLCNVLRFMFFAKIISLSDFDMQNKFYLDLYMSLK